MLGRPSGKERSCTPARPEVLHHVRRWITKAEDDFAAAGQLLDSGSQLFSIVAFHAQQCVEKYLKAVLVLEAVAFPRTHDLVLLRTLLPRWRAQDFGTVALERLTRYSVEERYPGDAPPVTHAEASEALAIAAAARAAARKGLPPESLSTSASTA